MAKRALYVAAYDVSEPARPRRVHHLVKRFATGGRKPAFERVPTPSEREGLPAGVCEVLAEDEDRMALLRIEPRVRPMLLRVAVPAVDPEFFCIG